MNDEIRATSSSGVGRTFTVSHREADDNYSIPSSSGAVPAFALRRAAGGGSNARSGVGSGGGNSSACPVGSELKGAQHSVQEQGAVSRCPLGFGGRSAAVSSKAALVAQLPTITLEALSRHNGQVPHMPTFISIKGMILDVSGDTTGTFQVTTTVLV